MRFIVSSSALLKMLIRHHECPVHFRIAPFSEAPGSIHIGTLMTPGLTNELPVEALHASSVETALPLVETLRALRSIEDQPITLDLHAHGNNCIYATRRVDTVQGWEHIQLPLTHV